MTIEQLVELSVEKLEAMSDKELIAHCAPYFSITRPDMASKEDHADPMKAAMQAAGRKPGRPAKKGPVGPTDRQMAAVEALLRGDMSSAKRIFGK